MVRIAVVRRSGVAVRSMERFADAMLAADPSGVGLVDEPYDPPGAPGAAGRLVGQGYRWLVRPLTLRRLGTDGYHVVDHSDAHLLRLLPARRTVVTCHDLSVLRAASGELPWAGRAWWAARFRWSVSHLPLAGAVACPSEATRQDVLRLLRVRPERAVVIPQGVDPVFRPLDAEVRARRRAQLGVGDRPVVLHVASGGFYKNVTAAVRVVAALAAGGSDAILLRVGTPLDEHELRLVRDLGVADRLLQAPRLTDEELVEHYGAADVLLFPSTVEGFGWPLLEAMACGLPAVTSTAPALAELGGDAARRAGAHDIADLAAQISEVLGDPGEQDRLRAAGLERAAGYTWERAHRAYAQLYRQVTGDDGGADG